MTDDEQKAEQGRQERARHAPERVLDATALHGLAHPLRVQLWDELNVHGSATASMLARKLGESSGATSYHLRQLERHGFVEEDPGRGTGRERWWRAVAGGVTLRGHEMLQSRATREAANLVLSEWHRGRAKRLENWRATHAQWPTEWVEASLESTSHLRVSREELQEVREELLAVVTSWVEKVRGRGDDDDRVDVEIQLNVFPVGDPEDLRERRG
ncbi:MAG: ArsR/SmtB family transcription factor [Actinomycetes bacterium]